MRTVDEISIEISKVISKLNVGDQFNLNNKLVNVIKVVKNNPKDPQSINKTVTMLIGEEKLILRYKYGSYYSTSTKKSNPGAQFYRDAEAQIMVDLINQNNIFHNNSKLYQLIEIF